MRKAVVKLRAIILAPVLSVFMASAALAQGNTWIGANLSQMVETARWKLGIMRLNAALEILNAGYDTDIYYGYLEPVPDGTFSAGLPIQLLLPLGKKAVLDVSERPEYLFYFDTERERAWNHAFRGRTHFALDKIYFQAGGGISSIRQRQSTEIFVNLREKRDNLNGLLFWQASKDSSLAILYDWSKFDYGSEEFNGIPLAETMARQERYLDLVGFIQPSSRVRLSLDVQYGSYVFTNTISSMRDSRSHGVFGGVEFIPRESETVGAGNIRGSLKLGYQHLDLIDAAQRDGDGIVGEGNISVNLSSRTSARVFYTKGLDFSVYGGATFFSISNFGAGLSRLLTRRIAISYDGSFGRTVYPGSDGVPGMGERFMTHMVSLNLSLSRQMSMMLFATYDRRLREATGIYYHRAFFGINLTYGYPVRGMALPFGGLSH